MKGFLSAILIVLWLTGTGMAFWWLDLNNRGPYPVAPTLQLLDRLEQESDSIWSHILDQRQARGDESEPEVILIHFMDPSCRCQRFTLPHLREIDRQFPDVETVLVLPGQTRELKKYSGWPTIQWPENQMPAASPSAMVITRNQGVIYLGPYSDSFLCTAAEDALVERMLLWAREGQPLSPITQAATGCFCTWPTGHDK